MRWTLRKPGMGKPLNWVEGSSKTLYWQISYHRSFVLSILKWIQLEMEDNKRWELFKYIPVNFICIYTCQGWQVIEYIGRRFLLVAAPSIIWLQGRHILND
jgi:hypothetical protein